MDAFKVKITNWRFRDNGWGRFWSDSVTRGMVDLRALAPPGYFQLTYMGQPATPAQESDFLTQRFMVTR